MDKCMLFLLIITCCFMSCEAPITDGVSEVAEREGIKHHQQVEQEIEEFYPNLDTKEEQLQWVKQQLKHLKLDVVAKKSKADYKNMNPIATSVDTNKSNKSTNQIMGLYEGDQLKQLKIIYSDASETQYLYFYADKLLACELDRGDKADNSDFYYYFDGEFLDAQLQDTSLSKEQVLSKADSWKLMANMIKSYEPSK